MNAHKTLISVVLIMSPVTAAAQGSAADEALDRAVAAYASVRTARASFEQTITNALTGSTVSSKGEFQQARPDRFVFRFSDPKGDLIVCDGRNVWLYLPSTSPGQVIKAPLTADIEGSIDLIGAFFVNPRSQYTVTDAGAATVGSHSTRALALVPRKAGASFVRAKIWVDTNDGLLRQFEAVEHSGITRRVRVIDYAPNASVATSAFSFKPPKGVKVVDGASLR